MGGVPGLEDGVPIGERTSGLQSDREGRHAGESEGGATVHEYDRLMPTFVQELEASKTAVDLIARYLCDHSYQVVINPTFIRPDPSCRHEFADEGDLAVIFPVEVKHLNEDFTSLGSYNHGMVTVDTIHHFDAMKTKPLWYFLLSRDLKHMLVVDVPRTREEWDEYEKPDMYRGGLLRRWYRCPKNLVEFRKLED